MQQMIELYCCADCIMTFGTIDIRLLVEFPSSYTMFKSSTCLLSAYVDELVSHLPIYVFYQPRMTNNVHSHLPP